MTHIDLASLGRVASRFLGERRVRASDELELLAAYAIGADKALGPEWVTLGEAGFYDLGSPLRVAGDPVSLYEATRPTPLLATRLPGCGERIWLKLEWFNPFSLSMKDRTVYELLLRVEGESVWEASSGNTGVALAAMASMLGLKSRVYLPRHSTRTVRLLIRLLGGDVVETDAPSTTAIQAEGEGRLGQFDSPWNPIAHMRWTGREIIVQLEHAGARPGLLVVPSGTGGTVAGTGFMLKNYYHSVRIARVIPAEGEVIEGTRRAEVGWLRELGVSVETVEATRREALEGMLLLARTSGLAPGVSGGASVSAALRLCREYPDIGDIVVVLPDHASKYPEALEEALNRAGDYNNPSL